jgi:hypothetical protein
MGKRGPSRPGSGGLRRRSIDEQAERLAESLDGWALPREKVLTALDPEGAKHARALARELRKQAGCLRKALLERDPETAEAVRDVLEELRVLATHVVGDAALVDASFMTDEPSEPAEVDNVQPSNAREERLGPSPSSERPVGAGSEPVDAAEHDAGPALARIRLRQTRRMFPAVRPSVDAAERPAAEPSAPREARPPSYPDQPARPDTVRVPPPAPSERTRPVQELVAPRVPRSPSPAPSRRVADDRADDEGGSALTVERTWRGRR